MIYVTRFDIFSSIHKYAKRVHTKYIFTAHAMTNAEKEALKAVYIKEYSDDSWRVEHVNIDCTVIIGGENE